MSTSVILESTAFGRIMLTQYALDAELEVYPVTITQARYGGGYEGAPWLAFPCDPSQLDPLCRGWDDDITCANFWLEVETLPHRYPIGRGSSPSSAYDDLLARVQALPCTPTPT